MARVPNYIYRGDNLGIGQGISNLGQALFGDPQAASALEAQRTQNEYTRTLMAEHAYETETKRADRERNQAISKSVLDKMGLGSLFSADGSSPAASPTMEAAAPSLLPPPPVVDHYAGTLDAAKAPPTITAQPLGPIGAPAPQVQATAYSAPSLADSDVWNQDDYTAKMQQKESSARPGAKNPNSSAYGLSQFTKGTWRDVGMEGTPQDATPEMYADATNRLTTRNRDQLTKYYGEAPDAAGTYTAHHYGATGAEGIINAAMDEPNTPINKLISPEAFAANQRELTNPDGSVKTAGQLMGEYQAYFKGSSPIQPQAGEAPSSLAQTMTPDINELNPQLQSAMPEPAAAPPMLAKTPGSLMNSVPASQPISAPAGPTDQTMPPAPGALPMTTPTQAQMNRSSPRKPRQQNRQPGSTGSYSRSRRRNRC